MAPPAHGNTKTYQIYIHHVHIADGFADDCEELIHRWLKTETLTYETFCEIWKDMQFNFLYHGRSSGAEMAELSEELLHIAKHYMVSNTDNFEESIAGLFLVYAILNLQPYQRFASLRLVPEDVAALGRIETRARRERRYDVLYILGSVLIEGPTHYHVANRERGMEGAIRKYLEGTTGIDRMGIRPKGVFYRQNEESDLLRELNSVTKRYGDAKRALGGESSLGLNYTSEKLATELESSLKGIINGIIDEGPEANKKLQEHISRVQLIKEKAMRQAVDGVKHLASVTNKNSPRASGSNSPSLDAAPRSRRRPARKKRRLISDSDTTDSDTEDSLDSLDDSGPRPVRIAKNLNLEPIDNEKDLEPAKGEEEKEIDIQIESLPVFIRAEQDGKTYEIEVIDKLADQSPSKKTKQDAGTILKNLTDVSIEKLDAGEGTSKTLSPKGLKEQRLRKKEKRLLKKPAVMTKLKRMGVAPMVHVKGRKKNKRKSKKQPEQPE